MAPVTGPTGQVFPFPPLTPQQQGREERLFQREETLNAAKFRVVLTMGADMPEISEEYRDQIKKNEVRHLLNNAEDAINDLSFVRSAFNHLSSVPERTQKQVSREVLKEASSMGKKKIVNEVLEKGRLDSEALASGIKEAARFGYDEIIDTLLEHVDLTDEQRNAAAREPIDLGELSKTHFDALQTLMDDGPVSPKIRGTYLRWATAVSDWPNKDEGFAEIMTGLLKNDGGKISQQDQEDALMEAVKKDEPECVQALLDDGDVSMDAVESALEQAEEMGHYKTVDRLRRAL